MKKQLIQNINEYRQWAWKVLKEVDEQRVENAVGVILIRDCWDTNANGEDIDEHGKVIPKDTAETVKLEDWVAELQFPVIAVYWVEKDYDRFGSVSIVAVEFVSRKEFI